MAVADEIAAQAAKDALQKELQGKFNIEDAFAQARQAATASNQTVLDQLTQNAADYQDQFNKDARSAYINKMQSGLKLENELSRLGLGNAGYGVTQRLMNESTYGTNLANLQDALSKNLRAIDQSKAQAQTDLGNTLADLALKQSDKQVAIDQYITNLLQDTYNNAYNRNYNERMDQAQLAASYSRGGGYSSGGSDYSSGVVAYGQLADSYGDGKGNVIYTDASGNQYKMKANYNPYTGTKNTQGDGKGWFANGYQPDNIGGTKLTPTGKTTPVNGQTQKIWEANGTYYYWDGTVNRYYKCTNAQLKAAGLKK